VVSPGISREIRMHEDRVYASYVRACRLKRRSEETIKLYGRAYAQLRKHTATPLLEIDRWELEEFFELRGEVVAASTVHKDYRNLRALFRWLKDEQYRPDNPLARIELEAPVDRLPRVLSDEELQRLFRACSGSTFRDRRDLAIIRLMSEIGGPRRGEIGAVKVDDLDWFAQVVTLTGKTGSRRIYFGDRTAAALERYMKVRDKHKLGHTEWLWLPSRGPMPAETLRAIVGSRGRRAGIGHVTCHTLRHTAAHRAMAAGMGGQDMQTLFGWAGPQMLAVYGRILKVSRAHNAAKTLALGDQF
jgi:integrase/recombinase XerD